MTSEVGLAGTIFAAILLTDDFQYEITDSFLDDPLGVCLCFALAYAALALLVWTLHSLWLRRQRKQAPFQPTQSARPNSGRLARLSSWLRGPG